MLDTALRLVGFDFQRLLARVREQAEDLKDRTTHEIKSKVAEVAVTLGFMLGGLVLCGFAIAAGLFALYLAVARDHGPFVALGLVAAVSAFFAVLLFTIGASRNSQPKRPDPARASVEPLRAAATSPVPPPPVASVPPGASFVEAIKADLTDKSAAAANEALNSAATLVRNSPREAILVALAAAVVTGVLVGRRRQ